MRYKNILSFLAILITLAFSGLAFSATYTYDNANRLISVDYGNGTAVNYTYDAAGNRISMAVVDVAPPTGSIMINGGAPTTLLTSATLNLSATDNSGTVSQVRFSNDNATWSTWEPYVTTKAWTLSDGNGTKTAYAETGLLLTATGPYPGKENKPCSSDTMA